MADLTKYMLTIGSRSIGPLHKNRAIFETIRHLVQQGHSPKELTSLLKREVPKRKPYFCSADGRLSGSQMLLSSVEVDGTPHDPINERRWFLREEELFQFEGKTWAFTSQWSGDTMIAAMEALIRRFPGEKITFTPY